MPDLTIGQHIDAIRQRCAELGIDMEVQLRAWHLSDHDAAKQAAIQVTNEMGGFMLGPIYTSDRLGVHWYRTERPGADFVGYWEVKENLPVQAAVVNG